MVVVCETEAKEKEERKRGLIACACCLPVLGEDAARAHGANFVQREFNECTDRCFCSN